MKWNELFELKKDMGIAFSIYFEGNREVAALDILNDNSVKNRKGGILLPGYHKQLNITEVDLTKPFRSVVNELFNKLTEEYVKDRDFTLRKNQELKEELENYKE